MTAALFCAACGLGLFMINLIVTQGVHLFLLSLGMMFLAVWVTLAGPRWWLPLPAAVTFGGMFYFGFKIYLHEMAVPFCILALLPVVALRRASQGGNRERMPFVVWLFAGFFILEWLVSYFALKASGMNGAGSMTRIYIQGFWPILFLILFYSFGDTRFLRTALILMYIACILRVIVTLLASLSTELLHLPYLNFVFSSSAGGIIDFRFSGIQLLLLSLCFAHISRRMFFKVLHLFMTLIGTILIFFGGGRVSVGMLCMIPLLWALFFRRIGMLTILSLILLMALIFLNRQPQVIYRFPSTVQRALSVLVLEQPGGELDWHESLQSSNNWHSRLAELGRIRWLSNPATFFFGQRAEPYNENYATLGASMETKAQVAARMGQYEAGLWTVLGLTGLCGFLFYTIVFWYLLKDVLRSIWLEGMSSYVHVIGFIAVIQLILWVLFSWIAGGFPSQELLMAILARYSWEDSRSKMAEPIRQMPSPSNRLLP